ncbi:MAG: SemiSWEET transporter [Pseudomonadota bacterium]
MMTADLVGTLAACLTTASFLPQAVKVFQTRNTEGISLTMYAMFCLGVALWLAYGVMTGAMPVILANAVTLVLASGILTMKLRAVLSEGYGTRPILSQ